MAARFTVPGVGEVEVPPWTVMVMALIITVGSILLIGYNIDCSAYGMVAITADDSMPRWMAQVSGLIVSALQFIGWFGYDEDSVLARLRRVIALTTSVDVTTTYYRLAGGFVPQTDAPHVAALRVVALVAIAIFVSVASEWFLALGISQLAYSIRQHGVPSFDWAALLLDGRENGKSDHRRTRDPRPGPRSAGLPIRTAADGGSSGVRSGMAPSSPHRSATTRKPPGAASSSRSDS